MSYLYKTLIYNALMMVLLTGCKGSDAPQFSGYTYGEFIYLSHNTTEIINNIFIKKGEKVKKGQNLVQMENFSVENSLGIASKNYEAERALLRNMNVGERTEELNVIRSQLERAKSAAKLAQSQVKRYQRLYETHVVSEAEWDNVREDYAQKTAQVKELASQINAKKLPARNDEIKNQLSRVDSAKLQVEKANWDVDQNIIKAPEDALVYDIIYRPGERPLAGKPIISLLAPENIKVRFFVPEKMLGNLAPGRKVTFLCDGCSADLNGVINYISPQAEYSPPVIYSTVRREKLLFMVEAIPDGEKPYALKPGQPVEVRLSHE